jgi:hypothetical protein
MFTKYSAKPIKAHFSVKDGIKFLVTAGLIVWFMFVSTGKAKGVYSIEVKHW